jgi:hypothetical protein
MEFPQLRFSVNASAAPVRSVPLQLLSDDGCLFVSPEQLDFGVAAPSCGPRVQSFGVGNRCATDEVNLAGVRVSGQGPFVVEGSAQLRLTPHSFVPDAVRVKFDPVGEGVFVGQLEFDVQVGAGLRPLLVPLRGASTAAGRQRDRFVMPTSADVLFVQDTTPTMAPLWQGLPAQAQAFVDAAAARARAVRVAAIDADPAVTGLRDVGGAPWLDLELSPVAPLGALLGPAATGAAAEASRDPVLRVLTAGAPGQALLRRGASLNVLVATDARDQSAAPVSVALPQLAALKGSHLPELLSWSVVGPLAPAPPMGCAYDDPVTNPADELAPVAMTGGVSLEVCAARATPALVTSQVVPTLFGDRDTLALRAPISPGALPVVTVGGVGVPELTMQGARNWTFDVTRRAVTFSGLSLRAGEVVELDYPTLCP